MLSVIFGLIILISVSLPLHATEPVVSYDWETHPIREDLYQRRDSEIQQNQNNNQNNISEQNQKLLESIQNYNPEVSSGRLSGITLKQGQMLISKLINDPLNTDPQKQYDPEGELGFCFGRALKLHLDLLRYGLNKESIKKIFVVGPMNVPGKVWQFHVATIVKDLNSNEWWALDTSLRRPVSVGDWMKHYERFRTDQTFRLFRSPHIDITKSLRFYITQPQKIGPSGWEYNIQQGGLFDAFYNGYFKDMFKSFKQYPVPVSEKFNFNQCQKLFE